MFDIKVDSAHSLETWNQNAGSQQVHDEESLSNWLIDRLAECLCVDASSIEVDAPLASHGLSSRDAVVLSGDLEDLLNRRLSPTLVWEHPTITSLARYLTIPSAT